jgi:hypothetical protein
VYIAPIGSKHKSESLFQNLAADIVEVQTLGGIILLGGDFNVRIASLLDTIDTSDLCEQLQAPELIEIKSNQVLWLSDKIVTPMLVARAASSWPYAVTLGYSSSMAECLVTNQGSSFVWQMGAHHY